MKIQRIMPATTHSMKDALPLGTILTVKNVADQKYIVVGYDTSSFPHNYYEHKTNQRTGCADRW